MHAGGVFQVEDLHTSDDKSEHIFGFSASLLVYASPQSLSEVCSRGRAVLGYLADPGRIISLPAG